MEMNGMPFFFRPNNLSAVEWSRSANELIMSDRGRPRIQAPPVFIG